MAGNGGIKFDFGRDEMRQMFSAIVNLVKSYQVTDETDMLLWCHLAEIRDTVAKRLINRQEKSLSLHPKDAIAFWAILTSVELAGMAPFEREIIRRIRDEADQYVQSLKPQILNEQILID